MSNNDTINVGIDVYSSKTKDVGFTITTSIECDSTSLSINNNFWATEIFDQELNNYHKTVRNIAVKLFKKAIEGEIHIMNVFDFSDGKIPMNAQINKIVNILQDVGFVVVGKVEAHPEQCEYMFRFQKP